MGLHAIDSEKLPLIIQGYYADALSMPVYLNILEDAQRKSLITDLPLSEANILATETKSIFASQEYPDKSREWEREPKDAKTWATWKLRNNRAYEMMQLVHQASDGKIHFNSANSAMTTWTSGPQHSNVLISTQPPSAGEPIEYKKLESYFGNLAQAATNKKAVLLQLFAAVASLTATNATLMEDIRVLTANNKYIGGLKRSMTTNKPGKEKGKGKGRWAKGESGSLHYQQVLAQARLSY